MTLHSSALKVILKTCFFMKSYIRWSDKVSVAYNNEHIDLHIFISRLFFFSRYRPEQALGNPVG